MFILECIGNRVVFYFRTYTDNAVVQRLKATIEQRGEGQFTLVNYKKNGEPFLNHLTVIPIKLYGGTEYSHYIGLQIDLIAQPQAIMKRLQNGTYSVNYQQEKTIALADIVDEGINENIHLSSSGMSNRSTIAPNFVEKVFYSLILDA
jgi:PAS domain